MTSPGAARHTDNPPAAGARVLAYTPEQAAAIIGMDIKASYLRRLAREGKVGCLRGPKYGFTMDHIHAIVRYMEKPAKATPAPAAHAKDTRKTAPERAPVVEMLTARPSPRRTG